MPNDQALAQLGGAFNSEFNGWTSGGVTNPKNGLYFCEQWFFTAVRRGRQTDVGLEPLNVDAGSGLRLILRDPPEMVRVWHKLPEGFLEGGRKIIKVRLRGIPDGDSHPQLDAAALFQGTDEARKVDRKLFGPLRLEPNWREFTTELRGNSVEVEGSRYVTLRFSGKGTIELEYCRTETATFKTAAWPAAKGLAAKMLSGFRDTQRSNAPARAATPDTATIPQQPPAPPATTPPPRPPAGNGQVKAPAGERAAPAIAPLAASSPVRATSASAKPLAPAPAQRPSPPPAPAVRAPAAPAKRAPATIARPQARPPAASAKPAATPAPRPPVAAPDRQQRPATVPAGPQGKLQNLLQNAGFEQWSARQPDHWKIEVPPGVVYARAEPSADRPFKATGLNLTYKKALPGRGVELSQPIDALGPKQPVDVALVACADMRTEIEIVLTQNGEDTATSEARARITLWPRWQLRTARIRTPSNWKDSNGRITLIVPTEQAQSVHFAFVGAGLPGADLAPPFEIEELRSQDSNALVNSSFEYWTGPLKRALSVRRVEVTDEWALVNKSPSPNVEVRLTEIVPRGLRDGREYAAVLGLAVHGELAGPYLRMEAALDVLQMLAGPPRQLAFFARTAMPATGGAVREQSTIQQVFVAERRRLAPESDEFSVSRLFTIKRNLRIGRIGERYVVELRPEHRALLAAKAREVLHDPLQSLLLIFECTGAVDLALGSVSFGSNVQAERDEAEGFKEIALEDPHIAAQLTRLKGVEHWQMPIAMQAMPYRPQAAANTDHASWSWLPDSKLTTDIVICVYNAIEETLGCLDSIRRCTTVPHTVTIIDDKSNDLTREQLRRYVAGKPWMRLIENPKNLGYTRSANIGLSSSSAEWVVLLNSDTVVTPGWLEGLFEVVKAKPNAVMIGPLSNAASWQSIPELHDVRGGWSTNPLPEGCSPDDIGRLVTELSPKMFPDANLLNGFCTLMRRDVIEQMGYLDEVAFPMGYGEENDLCLRVRKAGYTLAIADHVYVYHVKSASFGSARRAELSKRGTAQLHLKHPDVDMKATQAQMAELTSLIELRKKLRDRLNPAAGRDFGATPGGPWQAVASP